tara:strand:- start:26 stop:592 length:567 start_codon:yes stop_codon:yes gene_type:complete
MYCRYRQFRISQAVDGGHPLPSWLRRHVATCSGCAAHHEEQRRVAALLARASEHQPEAPPFLKERIMNAISAEPQIHTQPPLPAWAHAITAVALVALTWTLWQPTTTETQQASQPQSPSEPGKRAEASRELPGISSPPVENALSKLSISFTTPYENELNNLKNDLAVTKDFLGDRLASMGLAGLNESR